MNIPVYNISGKEIETLELDKSVFDGYVNHSLMHQAVVTYLSNQRKGLASTKTRGEVSGGGKKPWRQKSTGRARVGSTRSPLWRGGGKVFGPKPHLFKKDLPKKMKALALKSTLNAKLNDKEIIVLDSLQFNSQKTKDFFKIVVGLKLANEKVRFIVEKMSDNLKLGSRNIKDINVEEMDNLTTYGALNCKKIVFTKNSLRGVEDRVKKCLK